MFVDVKRLLLAIEIYEKLTRPLNLTYKKKSEGFEVSSSSWDSGRYFETEEEAKEYIANVRAPYLKIENIAMESLYNEVLQCLKE